MKTEFKIRPLLQGSAGVPMGFAIRWEDMKTIVNLPVFMFYIEGPNEEEIVVESGMGEAVNGFLHGIPATGGGEKATREVLNRVNTTPEEVNILILSHLHLDHAATASLFKKAKIYVQKSEWDHAFNPEPFERLHYIMDDIAPMEKMNLALVEGNYRIMEGLELLALPGHSPGNQGVAVSTKKGTAVLCGDVFYQRYQWEPTLTEMTDSQGQKFQLRPMADMPLWPQGNTYCFQHWYNSAQKVIATVSSRELIYPTHDPELIGREELP